jgi:hypothetical protein
MKFKFLVALVLVVIGVANARTIVDVLLQIGNGTDVDVEIEAELGKGVSNPSLKYNTTDDAWEFCNEGAACQQMGSGGGIPLLGKGSLLTSNGTSNGEFTACADGEIIEWDSAETNGFKCVTKPVDTNAGTLCAAGEYLDGDGTCKTVPSGGAQAMECQRKLLPSDILESTTEITSLTMNNLTIGKKYELRMQMFMDSNSDDDLIRFQAYEGTDTNVQVCGISTGLNANIERHGFAVCTFVASNATLRFRTASQLTPGHRLLGANNINETWVQLCELDDSTVLNSTKFN